MASSMNKVMLMGNITRDIELRHTSGNQAVATIGIAVNRRWRTPEGEQREETTFVDCDAWGKTAEMIKQYFAKGRPILIEGRLKLDTWQDKESGANRSKLKVVIENFYFVDGKSGGGAGGGGGGEESAPASRPPARSGARAGSSQPAAEPIGEDDIPF